MPKADSRLEKRILERNIFPYPIDFEIAQIGQEKTEPITLTGDGVDISSNGVGMWTTASLVRGAVVKLYIPIPSQKTCQPCLSEVRWVESGNRHSRVGLQFLS
jgi:hypothetical protein